MLFTRCLFVVCIGSGMLCGSSIAQQSNAYSSATVPRLVNFSGKATDLRATQSPESQESLSPFTRIDLSGAPLWLESQSVRTDAKGNYTAQLGATKPEDLPLELFASGEARLAWCACEQRRRTAARSPAPACRMR